MDQPFDQVQREIRMGEQEFPELRAVTIAHVVGSMVITDADRRAAVEGHFADVFAGPRK